MVVGVGDSEELGDFCRGCGFGNWDGVLAG